VTLEEKSTKTQGSLDLRQEACNYQCEVRGKCHLELCLDVVLGNIRLLGERSGRFHTYARAFLCLNLLDYSKLWRELLIFEIKYLRSFLILRKYGQN
jgi:hypothetical protein